MNNNENKDILDTILVLIASVLGFFGSLQNIDLFLGILLKFCSILSFLVFILLNRKKIIEEVKDFFTKK